MTHPAAEAANEFNAGVIAEFRANAGHVGGPLAETTIILVHLTGARSGTERVVPLACSRLADGRLVIVATNGGSPTHPAWYHNLRANPRITVEVGTETFTATAKELDDTDRAALWPSLIAQSPSIGEFQDRTTRKVPVFVLTPAD